MRRPLSADPVFFAILDAESRVLGCSSSCLVRCSTLDMIARNNQARIPGFFKEERESKIYLDALHQAHDLWDSGVFDKLLANLCSVDPAKFQQELCDTIYHLLEVERNHIFHRSKRPVSIALKPE